MTRTNLEVEPISRTRYLFGKRLSDKTNDGEENVETTELQFIYLDSDLCITMIDNDSGVLNIYTKNEEWRESRKDKVCLWNLFV